MKNLIELSGICKKYQRMLALDDVSLTVGEGITGLLGPNGAGKSTLIKVLMGLVSLNAGHGSFMGLELERQGREIRARVGYMPEDDCYLAGMTGIEMVRFSATLAGIYPVEALRRSHEILDFCGVHQERYRSVEGYSTGMRQKVKFAAAIVHDPDYLILDEPTSGLDPEEREALLNRVRILCEKFGKSALLSTHILPDVQSVCNHVIILSNGRVRVSDSLYNLNRTDSPIHLVNVVTDPGVAINVLQHARFRAEGNPDNSISIWLESMEAFSRFWEICDLNGIVVRSLTRSRNSIEQIFMDAIRGDTHAHS